MRTGYPKNGISTLGLADNVTVVVGKLLFEYPTIAHRWRRSRDRA